MRALTALALVATFASLGCMDLVGPGLAFEVEIAPQSITLNAIGDTARFTLEATNLDGDPIADATASWTSTNARVATVDASGVVTAVGDGSAEVSATVDGVVGSATVTVQRTAGAIEVTPGYATIRALRSTVQLATRAQDASGVTMPAPRVSWSSSVPEVATVSSTGVVTALRNGATTIKATADDLVGSATVTVSQEVSGVTVTPANTTLSRPGETRQLAAAAVDAGGAPVPGALITWSTSRPDVATVNAAGSAQAVGSGVTTMRASAGIFSAAATVTVDRGPTVQVDQRQGAIDISVGGIFVGGNSTQKIAQTVTGGKTGHLIEIELPIACSSGELTVEIQGVAGGRPDGAVRGRTVVPWETYISSGPIFRTIALSTPVPVTAGERYAIVITSSGTCGMFRGPAGDAYPGGTGYFDALPNRPGWEPLGDRPDLPFIVRVEVAP